MDGYFQDVYLGSTGHAKFYFLGVILDVHAFEIGTHLISGSVGFSDIF